MDKFKQIIRWPANEMNDRAPWYQVAWRMLWILPSVVVLIVYCALIGVAYGLGAAEATWEDNI